MQHKRHGHGGDILRTARKENPMKSCSCDVAPAMLVLLLGSTGLLFAATGCGGSNSVGNDTPRATATASPPPSGAGSTRATAAAGPIDVCGVVTPSEAAAILGPLPPQPPSKTDNAGFGIYSCMHIGPAISGQGAQTIFTRLTVQAGSGKDVPDLMQMDADKRKATIDLPGVGEAAKRSANGLFVWAKQAGVYCTAEMSNGLPRGLTGDSAASQLGGLCRKIFARY
jgi:hypothetical protein